jgi:2,4-dienoyl-CoA reductase-like NADH-dependent reductase (Old Yellow Enzyme family)
MCGKPTDKYRHLYDIWGQGGIGTIILGNIPCDRRKPQPLYLTRSRCKPLTTLLTGYPEAAGNAIIDPLNPWNAAEAFKPVIAAAKAKGSLVIGQITHAGRVSTPWPPLFLCETLTNQRPL